MSADKFCLRWNDFESNVSSAFRDLREEKDFFDVTLACEDSQMEAHKVILSACSPFFKNILRRNPHQHPLLYLKGVKSIELSNVLSFMYQGEVNVAQDSLNTFLTVAEELQVKGLTQEGGQQSSVKHKSESDHSSSKHQQKLRPNFPSAPTSFQNPSHDRDIQEVVHIKPEATGTHQAVVEPHQGVSDGYEEAGVVAHYDQGEFQYENYGESEDGALVDASVYDTSIDKGLSLNTEDINSMVEALGTGGYQCTECGHFSTVKQNLRKHIDAKHVYKQPIDCQYCDKKCPSKNALMTHISRYHKLR